MLYELFVKATSLSKTEQQKYLIEIKHSHPALFNELMEMIKSNEMTEDMDTQYWYSVVATESTGVIDYATNLVGTIISSFKLTKLIGKGGMGNVYEAKRCDEQFEQTVAIKIIHGDLGSIIGESALIREAGFMAKLTHPNIGKVFDAGISETGLHFIVMEYIDGCNIAEKFKQSSLKQDEKLKLFCDLCDAVNHAHQMQVIHADLKPANILITDNHQLKILDFGIARMFNSRSSDNSSAYAAYLNAMTANFASPEQLAGERPSMYSDIYALGKIFSSLFIYKNNENKYQTELESIVKKATSITPTDRYKSVLELKNDIRRFLTGHVVLAYQASLFYAVKKFIIKRHQVSVTVGVIFLVTLSTLVTNLVIKYDELKREKYQTDLMLEKFSLVLDLDYDTKSDLEMALANNYESRNENEKALTLYKKIVSKFDKLNDKDIAFNAGSKLIKLYIKMQRSHLIANKLNLLRNEVVFRPNSNLPATLSQAMFYHYFIGAVYYWEEENNIKEFDTHKDLMLAIKNTYWDALSNQQKVNLRFAMDKAGITNNSLQNSSMSHYPKPQTPSAINSLYQSIKDYSFSVPPSIYLPSEQQIINFLESAPIFWASTHEEYFSYERVNRAIFADGIIKLKEYSGIYNVNNNTLTMNFGEGEDTDGDKFIYVSSTLALSVPSGGDLAVLAFEDFIKEDANKKWFPKQLTNHNWYHIYDQSLSPDEKIRPSIVEIEFKSSTAQLVKGDDTFKMNWNIEGEKLILRRPNHSAPPIQLIKTISDNHIIVVKDGVSMHPSVLVNDKALADYIVNYWQDLLVPPL